MVHLQDHMRVPGMAAYHFATITDDPDDNYAWADDFGAFATTLREEDNGMAAFDLALTHQGPTQAYLSIDLETSVS